MRDIRKQLLRYSDAKCHLWNVYFLELVTDLGQCEPLEAFEAIDIKLFTVLVCNPLGIVLPEGYILGAEPLKEISVAPKQYIREIPVILKVPGTGTDARWLKTDTLPAPGLSFAFIELFQWNRYDFLNLPLVRCVVRSCTSHPEYVGREALIENHLVDFTLDESAAKFEPS